MEIRSGKILIGTASSRLISQPKSVQSMNFDFTDSFLWVLLATLHDRRAKLEKIAIQPL